jgi:hypothetical protein
MPVNCDDASHSMLQVTGSLIDFYHDSNVSEVHTTPFPPHAESQLAIY